MPHMIFDLEDTGDTMGFHVTGVDQVAKHRMICKFTIVSPWLFLGRCLYFASSKCVFVCVCAHASGSAYISECKMCRYMYIWTKEHMSV